MSRRSVRGKVTPKSKRPDVTKLALLAAVGQHSSIRKAAKSLGLHPGHVGRLLRQMGMMKNGRLNEDSVSSTPSETGKVRRYIITSAQNNTPVHEGFWKNLLVYAKYLGAEIIVSTFTYNKAQFGVKSVKAGTGADKADKDPMWFAEEVTPFIKDTRINLAKTLTFCGETNIIPTASRPLSGFETYTGESSGIFPHTKMAMESIPVCKGDPLKFNYTTGCVTLKNYLAMKAGLKADFHHCFGALIVEIDASDDWFVRQINAIDDGSFQDLDVRVSDGTVAGNQKVEAVTWGDVHVARMETPYKDMIWGYRGMKDRLSPSYQFLHDVFDGESVNRHDRGNFHVQYVKHVSRKSSVVEELRQCFYFLNFVVGEGCQTIVVPSNHDDFLRRWLIEVDYRSDPENARLHLEAQLAFVRSIDDGVEPPNFLQYCIERFGEIDNIKYLALDESFKICKGQIECGMHGHLGPNGARATPTNLARLGRKANTGHTHSAGIVDGMYVAGTSSALRHGYNKGPSSWSNSHVITYSNGKRAIVTTRNMKWRVDR